MISAWICSYSTTRPSSQMLRRSYFAISTVSGNFVASCDRLPIVFNKSLYLIGPTNQSYQRLRGRSVFRRAFLVFLGVSADRFPSRECYNRSKFRPTHRPPTLPSDPDHVGPRKIPVLLTHQVLFITSRRSGEAPLCAIRLLLRANWARPQCQRRFPTDGLPWPYAVIRQLSYQFPTFCLLMSVGSRVVSHTTAPPFRAVYGPKGISASPLNASRRIASVNSPVDKRQKLRPPAIRIFPLLVKTSLLPDILGPRVDGVHIASGDKGSRFGAVLGIFSPLVGGCARITPRDP